VSGIVGLVLGASLIELHRQRMAVGWTVAAASESREAHDRLVVVMPLLVPDRRWHRSTETAPFDDIGAYLLAGVRGRTVSRCHFRRGGPQPAYIRLPLRRATRREGVSATA
jgi:hypothetical protein